MTLLELLQLLRKHLRLVIALPLVCALAMGVASFAEHVHGHHEHVCVGEGRINELVDVYRPFCIANGH